MTNQITYIYTLSDPTTNTVKYVGKTINIKERYRTYIKQAKNCKRNNLVINWIKSLLKNNLTPKMDIIDEIIGPWEWLEKYWIAHANPMDNPEIRKKVSIKISNIIKTDEWKKNISISKLGVSVHTKEQKNKYSIMNSGKGNPMYGKKHCDNALNKMKLSVLQYTLNDEFIKEWPSAADIQRETNMLARSINRCAKGDRATAYGFKWAYKNKNGRS